MEFTEVLTCPFPPVGACFGARCHFNEGRYSTICCVKANENIVVSPFIDTLRCCLDQQDGVDATVQMGTSEGGT